MSWVAVAIGGSALIGGLASNSASNKQQSAAQQAAKRQMEMFNIMRSDLGPYRRAGNLALRDLMTRMGIRPGASQGLQGLPPGGAIIGGAPDSPMGMEGGDPSDPNFGQLTHEFSLQDFQESPAFQFNLQQGKDALDKAAAARGRFYAPSTLQDIAKFSQGLASNEYQNAFSNYQTNMQNIWNRLYNLTGMGQSAANQTGAFGMNAAANQGNFMTQGANAQAAGNVGMANSITGGVNNALNYSLYQQMLAQNQGSSLQQGMVPGQYSLNNPQYG